MKVVHVFAILLVLIVLGQAYAWYEAYTTEGPFLNDCPSPNNSALQMLSKNG